MARAQSPHQQKEDLVKVYRQALVAGVSLEKIEQKAKKLTERLSVAEKKEAVEVQKKSKNFRQAIPRTLRLGAAILPTVLLLLGIGLVGSATFPILAYYVGDFSENVSELKSPVPPDQLLDVTPLVVSNAQADSAEEFGVVGGAGYEDGPVVIDSALDYTDLSNWFAGVDTPDLQAEAAATSYKIDIPKVDVQGAEVLVGGTDLNRSLIQYPGTALPGQQGAPVIFGHSILRQFYNPGLNNPRRYNSIFSYIMTLEKGDKIYVTQDNVRYTYVVQNKTEVKPTDTYILSQRYDARQLKLVTCVPEGTYLRRGVVTAQLVKE